MRQGPQALPRDRLPRGNLRMAWEARTGTVAISRTERLESGSLEEGTAG